MKALHESSPKFIKAHATSASKQMSQRNNEVLKDPEWNEMQSERASKGEREIIEYLNAESRASSFESPLQIRYQNVDGMRKAFPDFLIILTNGKRLLLEVKGEYYLDAFFEERKIYSSQDLGGPKQDCL